MRYFPELQFQTGEDSDVFRFDAVRESGDPKKRKPYLPPDKQFLVTRNGIGNYLLLFWLHIF